MNKKLFYVLPIVFLIAAGCNKTSQTSPSQNQTNATPQTQSSKGSLKDLMAKGTQICKFTDDGSTGTVYVANGKVRTDIVATSNGQTTNVHSLLDGQTSYTWIDGQSMGFKSSTSQSKSNTSGASQSQQQVDPNKQMDFQCSAWTADSSKFVLPSGVQFTDFSSLNLGIPK